MEARLQVAGCKLQGFTFQVMGIHVSGYAL